MINEPRLPHQFLCFPRLPNYRQQSIFIGAGLTSHELRKGRGSKAYLIDQDCSPDRSPYTRQSAANRHLEQQQAEGRAQSESRARVTLFPPMRTVMWNWGRFIAGTELNIHAEKRRPASSLDRVHRFNEGRVGGIDMKRSADASTGMDGEMASALASAAIASTAAEGIVVNRGVRLSGGGSAENVSSRRRPLR